MGCLGTWQPCPVVCTFVIHPGGLQDCSPLLKVKPLPCIDRLDIASPKNYLILHLPRKKVDGGQRGNQPTNQAVEIMICTCIVYVLSRPCIDNTPTRDFLQHSSLLTLMYLYLWQSSSTSSFTARKLHFFAASEFQEKSKYLAQVEVKISAPKMMTKRWPQVSCSICWDSTSAKLWNIGTNFCPVLRPTSIMDHTLFNHSRLPISCKEAPLNIWRRFKPYE